MTVGLVPSDHALYLAVIQVDHRNGGANAEITVKVFMDDLQNALRNFSAADFSISAPEECCEKNYRLAAAYFSEHLSCRINGRPLTMALRDCRPEGDVFLLQFDMGCPVDWQELDMKADLFMEIYPTQSNVVSILHGAEKRYLRLTKKEASVMMVF